VIRKKHQNVHQNLVHSILKTIFAIASKQFKFYNSSVKTLFRWCGRQFHRLLESFDRCYMWNNFIYLFIFIWFAI